MNTSSKTPCQLLKEQAIAALEEQRAKEQEAINKNYDLAFKELQKTFPLLERTNRRDVAKLCDDEFLIDYQRRSDSFNCYLGYDFDIFFTTRAFMARKQFNTLPGYAQFLEWKKKHTWFGFRRYQTKPY